MATVLASVHFSRLIPDRGIPVCSGVTGTTLGCILIAPASKYQQWEPRHSSISYLLALLSSYSWHRAHGVAKSERPPYLSGIRSQLTVLLRLTCLFPDLARACDLARMKNPSSLLLSPYCVIEILCVSRFTAFRPTSGPLHLALHPADSIRAMG